MSGKNKLCICCSGKTYDLCCKPMHQGLLAQNAKELMRSRFSAYALNLYQYIIDTTHPASPEFKEDLKKWKKSLANFSLNSTFEGLEILDFKESAATASVTFVAHIKQKKQDATFTEKSFFEKIKGRWLYKSGILVEGHAPNLVTVGQMRVLPLAYYGNPILRRKCDPILEINDSVRLLAEEMIETMDACDGLGLAAPQVHHSVQMFVIRVPIEKADGSIDLGEAKVYINPKISDPSAKTWKFSEGCLSIPSVHADVERPQKITVQYTDLNGVTRKEDCLGWHARVIMHENDHLNGVLFIDYMDKEAKDALEPFLQRLNKRIHDGTEL